jgi:hypothetical protein
MHIVTFADTMLSNGQKPIVMREERITKVPREEDINKIISHGKLKYAVAYSVLRDSGMRPVELGCLKLRLRP